LRAVTLDKGLLHSFISKLAWKGVVSMQLRLLQSIKKKASFLEGRGLSQPEGESPPRIRAAEMALKWH
jgi:hypothetical protein